MKRAVAYDHAVPINQDHDERVLGLQRSAGALLRDVTMARHSMNTY